MRERMKPPKSFVELRKRAEKILNERAAAGIDPSDADLLHLIQELEVHQIELYWTFDVSR